MKIISGGQTGADLGALLGARDAGCSTGGYAPLGYLTEDGANPELEAFGLVQMPTVNYPARTLKNVLESEATLCFCYEVTNGTALTLRCCRKNGRPYKIFSPEASPEEVRHFMQGYNTVNIAGTRESTCPGIQDKVRSLIYHTLTLTL